MAGLVSCSVRAPVKRSVANAIPKALMVAVNHSSVDGKPMRRISLNNENTHFHTSIVLRVFICDHVDWKGK